jgi:multiple sugar transport system substrate-binding protein
VFSIAAGYAANFPTSSAQQKKQVTLTALLTDLSDSERWRPLFAPAMQELRLRHPDTDIQINYSTLPYNQTRSRIMEALSNNTKLDLISLDQIWLSDFAQRGFLTDLTNYLIKWGRTSDWYRTNFDGGVYKGKVYGIWFETDVRGIWYWKDLLNGAGIEPNSLQTWHGYLTAAKILEQKHIQPIHLNGDINSPDMWYPYLWMLGGDIIKMKHGHPTKGTYWFPAYNGSAGIRAMEFIRQQVNAGIKPQSRLDQQFPDKKFSVMISGSWMPSKFPRDQWPTLEQKVGFLPMFPVPDVVSQSSTMVGGWELAVPQTSQNKDLAWELLTLIVQPNILSPWLQRYAYLPTQNTIGSGPYSAPLKQTIPYYDKMVSMIPIGRARPSIPEYPQIAEHIRQAILEVEHGVKSPAQAMDDAAFKSAKVLGWIRGSANVSASAR